MSTGRPWFQLHLSTAVVLMFVAGGLLWANTKRASAIYGWSLSFREFRAETDAEAGPWYIIGAVEHWSYGNLILDIVLAICLFAVTVMICEFILRRSFNTAERPQP